MDQARHSCHNCSLGEFMAERVDAWKTALKCLQEANLKEGPDGEPGFDALDVMNLATFLNGANDS